MMKRKLLSIFALLCLTVSGAWADNVICTPDDIGKLLGSDGKVYATADLVPSDVTVSGMIACVNTTEKWGLVIGPSDVNWNSTEGSGLSNINQAFSACSGYNRPRPSAATSGWRLPSQGDFENMIGANGCLSADNLRQLKGRQANSCASDAHGIWGMQTDDGYWSGTQTTETSGNFYIFWKEDCSSYFSEGGFTKYVRPIFNINVTSQEVEYTTCPLVLLGK